MADPADLGAGGTQEYPNYADDEGKNICLAYFVYIWRRPIHFACRFVRMITCTIAKKDGNCCFFLNFDETNLHIVTSLCVIMRRFRPCIVLASFPRHFSHEHLLIDLAIMNSHIHGIPPRTHHPNRGIQPTECWWWRFR